jgi:hypothetical protein
MSIDHIAFVRFDAGDLLEPLVAELSFAATPDRSAISAILGD